MHSVWSVIRAVGDNTGRDFEHLFSTIEDGLLGSADNQAANVFHARVDTLASA